MLREAALAFVFVVVGSCNPTFAQRAVICPPHLSYCYEKPVLREMTGQDKWNQMKAELQSDLAAVEWRMRTGSYGLDYQLHRAQSCNSVRQDGC